MTALEFVRSQELSGFSGLLHFARDPLAALEEARRLHGPLVKYRQPGVKVMLVMEPSVIESLLVARARPR